MNFNWNKICFDLVNGLPKRGKEVIERRFGLTGNKKETLEAIGKTHNITRERVRQIQEDALLVAKERVKKYSNVFEYFTSKINSYGNLKKEDILLVDLTGEKFKNHASFLMTLNDSFVRFPENNEYHSFWAIEPKQLPFSKKVIKNFSKFLNNIKTPIAQDKISFLDLHDKNIYKEKINKLSLEAFQSFIEISKKIEKNQEGFWGLSHWPEINPRGIKDKAFIVLKAKKEPLHFNEVARFIGGNANPQSVHNELIKDERFILVGRGIYALKDWGYKEGVVQDVITSILKTAKKPLSKQEIIEKTLEQRLVKDKTVLLNLSNQKKFKRVANGKYILVKTA